MAYEIVSTSSPSNLDGKSGFGTVIKTQNLPMSIDIAVSGLNGYTHLFGAGNPQNPVCWSYLQIRADNKTFYVMSRISDSGADHTLRSNRLASHLILQSKELSLCTAGPAAIMLGGEIIDSYNGIARENPERTIRPYQTQPPRPCQQWKQLAGDAGWGGVLAETILSNKVAYVIYNPGTDILPLFAESINLIPASFRWKVTFSTYYSSQIERYNCMWRGIVAGTNAVPQGDCIIIDLTKPLPELTTNSNLVTLARTGSGANSLVQPVSPSPTYVSTPPSPTSVGSASSLSASSNYSPVPSASASTPLSDPISAPPLKGSNSPRPSAKPRSLAGVWFVMFLMFLALIASGVALYYAFDSINKLKQENQSILTSGNNNNSDNGAEQDNKNDNQDDDDNKRILQMDSFKDELNSKINGINDQILALTKSINKLVETATTFVTKISSEENIDCSRIKMKNTETNQEEKLEWKDNVALIKNDNNEDIAKLTYNRQDKTFTLKFIVNPEKIGEYNFVRSSDLMRFNEFVQNRIFVYEGKNGEKYQFNFLTNQIINTKLIKDLNDELQAKKQELETTKANLKAKESEINRLKAEKQNNNNAMQNNNQLAADTQALQGTINTLTEQNKSLQSEIARRDLTSDIHFEKEFKSKTMTCQFSNNKTTKRIESNAWVIESPDVIKTEVVIDGVRVGSLMYNNKKRTFTIQLDSKDVRPILEEYSFRFASSEAVYFF